MVRVKDVFRLIWLGLSRGVAWPGPKECFFLLCLFLCPGAASPICKCHGLMEWFGKIHTSNSSDGTFLKAGFSRLVGMGIRGCGGGGGEAHPLPVANTTQPRRNLEAKKALGAIIHPKPSIICRGFRA